MQYTNAKVELNSSRSFNHTPSSLAKEAFFYVQSIGYFCCNENYYTEREGFRSYLLIYTIKGKGYLNYRGKQYEINANQIFLMDCYDYQKYYTDKQELWEMKWVHFNGGTSMEYFNTIYENYGPLIEMQDGNHIQQYIDCMMELIGTDDILLEVKVSPVIVQMLTDIMVSASIGAGGINKKTHNVQVEAALKYIESNYTSDILLGDIAKAVCSSKFNFSRVFKKITGYSPYEYLIKYRINKTKLLLITTDSTVDEIAGLVGFKSTSSLIKTFRELENMTPLKYRKFWLG